MAEIKTIGEQIKEARVMLGLTQLQVAEKSFVSVFTISALEQSKTKDCSTYIIRRLQKSLNIKIEIE